MSRYDKFPVIKTSEYRRKTLTVAGKTNSKSGLFIDELSPEIGKTLSIIKPGFDDKSLYKW